MLLPSFLLLDYIFLPQVTLVIYKRPSISLVSFSLSAGQVRSYRRRKQEYCTVQRSQPVDHDSATFMRLDLGSVSDELQAQWLSALLPNAAKLPVYPVPAI
jgi:hypothetical protein